MSIEITLPNISMPAVFRRAIVSPTIGLGKSDVKSKYSGFVMDTLSSDRPKITLIFGFLLREKNIIVYEMLLGKIKRQSY